MPDLILGMAAEFEQLAYDAALRALDKQEKVLEELRSRTGLLLAAAPLAVSFLGQAAFGEDPSVLLSICALLFFVASIGGCLFVLAPKGDLIFSQVGSRLYEGLYEVREDLPEVYRRLAYNLDRFWDENDATIAKVIRAYELAIAALVLEILCLVGLVSGTIF